MVVQSRQSGTGFSPVDAYVAAQLYYEQGLAQQEVADRMGVSRPSISRMLSYARDEGIVEIAVHAPLEESVLSSELAEALGLERTVVAHVGGRRPSLEAVASAALVELNRAQLGAGKVLGTSWGEMVSRVAAASPPMTLHGASVIPLVGAMDEGDPRFQSNEIARQLAERGGGNVVFIPAPIAPTAALALAISEDPYYVARLRLWDQLDAAVVGIGRRPSLANELPVQLEWSRTAPKAVGDVAGRLFTIDGTPVEVQHEPALLSVSREQIIATPVVVGVAAGTHKTEAIIGASRALMIKTLITDVVTARSIIDWMGRT